MTQAIQGTGLGLTIVQAIVDLHGGQISVSSSEGVGTTVSVSLPKRLPIGSLQAQSATP
jgi:signal transduction histidine kinase